MIPKAAAKLLIEKSLVADISGHGSSMFMSADRFWAISKTRPRVCLQAVFLVFDRNFTFL